MGGRREAGPVRATQSGPLAREAGLVRATGGSASPTGSLIHRPHPNHTRATSPLRYGNFAVDPTKDSIKGGEVNYVLFALEPVRLTVTTCQLTLTGSSGTTVNTGSTEINARVRIMTGCAELTHSVLLADNNPNYYCAYTEYEGERAKRGGRGGGGGGSLHPQTHRHTSITHTRPLNPTQIRHTAGRHLLDCGGRLYREGRHKP